MYLTADDHVSACGFSHVVLVAHKALKCLNLSGLGPAFSFINNLLKDISIFFKKIMLSEGSKVTNIGKLVIAIKLLCSEVTNFVCVTLNQVLTMCDLKAEDGILQSTALFFSKDGVTALLLARGG